jgi:hypothetical protein
MYSFGQRTDTRVIDEPFYAHYLLQSGADHPGRAAVIEDQPTDPALVLEQLRSVQHEGKQLFLKNMAHHMIKMDEVLDRLIKNFKHVFLIRDPRDMLLSLDKELPNPSLRDTAYQRQLELFEMVRQQETNPAVIDAEQLLTNPRRVLTKLCDQLDIPFQQGMLSWEAGPIPEDGIWAEHWYDNVHQSTGFQPYTPKQKPIPARLEPLYEECKPIYDKMFVHAIKLN